MRSRALAAGTLAAGLALVLALALLPGGERQAAALRPGAVGDEPRNVAEAELERPAQGSGTVPGSPPRVFEEAHPVAVFGRCVEHGVGRPVADVLVRLENGSERAGEARTDEEGRFTLEVVLGEDVRALVLPPRGWIPRGPPVALDEEQRAGHAEILLEVVRGRSAPVQGVVVASADGSAVFDAWVEIEMQVPRLAESVRTDGNGGFRTSVAFPPGELVARVLDEPRPDEFQRLGSARCEHLEDARARDWRIEVDVGPTFFVGPAGGGVFPGVHRWTAWVEETPWPSAGAIALRVDEEGFSLVEGRSITGMDPKTLRLLVSLGHEIDPVHRTVVEEMADPSPEERAWPQLPLREGPGGVRWLRYPNPGPSPDERLVARLLVADRFAEWRGEGDLSTTVGTHPGVVAVELLPIASVSGKVVDPTGARVRGSVELLPDGKPPARHFAWLEEGGIRFEGVEPGPWTVRVRGREHSGAEVFVRLLRGPNHLEPIVVLPGPRSGLVAGSLLTAEGLDPGFVLVHLRSLEGSRFRDCVWARPSGEALDFAFRGVPEGSYRVTAASYLPGLPARPCAWFPDGERAVTSTENVWLEAPGGTVRTYAFRARDTLGRGVAHFELALGPEGPLTGSFLEDARFRAPAGTPFRWTLFVPGFQPAHGWERDLVPHRTDEGEERIGDVRLRPGWGATLFLRGLPGPREAEPSLATFHAGDPLEGVAVYVDGEYRARSDAEGRVDLEDRSRPRSVVVDCPGWRAYSIGRVPWARPSLYVQSVLELVPDVPEEAATGRPGFRRNPGKDRRSRGR